MAGSRADRLYRSILLSKFFTKGWGKPENLKRIYHFRRILSDREKCMQLVDKDHPVTITKETRTSDYTVLEGEFVSPFVEHCAGLLPVESERARFQALIPTRWPGPLRPTVLHLAGTGDHYFWRRRSLLAQPLLKENSIASIILENPFYGDRKPHDQHRSSLRCVSDLFVMGGCLVLESIALFHWAERIGLGPLGITGISMGGHMASLAASAWPSPLSVVPCLSWTSASAAFTSGVLSNSIDWELLEKQYVSDNVYRNELTKMFRPVDSSHPPRVASLERQAPEVSDLAKELGKSTASPYSTNISGNDRVRSSTNSSSSASSAGTISGEEVKPLRASNKESTISRLKSMRRFPPISVVTSMARSKSKLMSSRSQASTTADASWSMVEATGFMRGVMDDCTHLANFPVPVDPELAVAVQARDDAYVPRDGLTLQELWPGCTVRYIDSGHIGAYLFNQNTFRAAIQESFDKLITKYNL